MLGLGGDGIGRQDNLDPRGDYGLNGVQTVAGLHIKCEDIGMQLKAGHAGKDLIIAAPGLGNDGVYLKINAETWENLERMANRIWGLSKEGPPG